MLEGPVSPAGRRYSLRPDAPDPRDHRAPRLKVARLPECANLISALGPVKDQKNLGCCTGFANAGLREFLYRSQYTWEKDKSVPPEEFVLSPLFLYYAERVIEGTVNEDSGASMRSGMLVLNQIGTCLEKDDPYDARNFTQAPTRDMILAAQRYRGGAYHRLETLDDMRGCLSSGYVFTLGIAIYDSFETHAVAHTGNVPIPDVSKEQALGGHAVLAYGYDDAARVLLVRNSWGKDWGREGNFQLPYEFLERFSYDRWIQHLGPSW